MINCKLVSLVLFLKMKKERKKSFPAQGLCCAPVIDTLFIQGYNTIISFPLIFTLNFSHYDLSLRPGLIRYERFSKSFY